MITRQRPNEAKKKNTFCRDDLYHRRFWIRMTREKKNKKEKEKKKKDKMPMSVVWINDDIFTKKWHLWLRDCSPVFCAPERNHNRFCSIPEHTSCDTNTHIPFLLHFNEINNWNEKRWRIFILDFYSELRRIWIIIMGNMEHFLRYMHNNAAIILLYRFKTTEIIECKI